MSRREQAAWMLLVGVALSVMAYAFVSIDNYAQSRPTPTVTVTAPPATVKVTVPGPVRTVTVTRASRSSTNRAISPTKPRQTSGKALDLRHARLWDRIAACESSGRWSLNTGLFDGGLQFLPSTWRSWGGTDFAPYAWQATRAEQITVANRSTRSRVGEPWLAPWPVCGRRAAAALGYKFP